jgi:cyclic pyranopterin phosphate synthase
MTYNIINRKIETNLCELNVVHHCNLSCRSCSHLSNRMNKYYVEPDNILKDLSRLAKYCRPQHVRLCGGEPLLHPNLLEVVDAVRDSSISKYIRVVTNGLLLHRMPDEFWQKVDQIHISRYPQSKLTSQNIRSFQQLSKIHNVEMSIRYVNRFRESFSELGTDDLNLVKRIYSTCKIAHTWCCQAIYEGYFYRCSPSIMIALLFRDNRNYSVESDGLKIEHSETFVDDLKAFLTSKKPLKACKYCLGTVGKRFVQEQNAYKGPIAPTSTEELISWSYLKYYEFVGHRQIPNLLKCIGKLGKKALFEIRNIGADI